MTPGRDARTAGRAGLRPLRRVPVVRRLVLAVAAVMSLVLAGTAGFVYWRVENALDQQLDGDLGTYHGALVHALERGTAPPRGPAGSVYQILDRRGRVLEADPLLRGGPLLTPAELASATAGSVVRRDVGALLPIEPRTLRLRATSVRTPARTVVAVAAIERGHRDEALRELLAQLAIAAALTLLAAALVGRRTARAALGPVERYRSGADQLADHTTVVRLPVPADRDDEITRLGHTLNRMLDRLEASAQRERRFVADASHELRTPLTLLRAELDVALHRPRSAEELSVTLRSVDTEVRKLIDLSDALLDLEQLGSGERAVRTPVDLAELVRSATDRHRRTAAASGRAVVVCAAGATVRVDSRRLGPAIANLVDNALRHGRGDVNVEAVAAAGRLRLSVADEGPGFPEEFLPRAFDRFARADVSRNSPGSGLGLALVAAVAASHGGTARAANTARGAEVTLDIPC